MMEKSALTLAVLVLSLAACGGETAVDTTSTTAPTTTSTSEGTTTTETAPTTTTAPETTTTVDIDDGAAGAIYLLAQRADSSEPGPFLVPAYRVVDGVEEALEALLEGPSDVEQDLGLSSAIPEGVEVNEVRRDGADLVIDLTREFESGGGTLSVTSRLAQLVFTVTRAAGVGSFTLFLDGEEVDVFSGEGLILDQPLERTDSEIVPPLLVETPPVLAPVSFPFEVRGVSSGGPLEYALTNWDGLVVAEGSTDVGKDGHFSFLVDPADAPLENLGAAPFDGTLLVSSAEGGTSEYPLVFDLQG